MNPSSYAPLPPPLVPSPMSGIHPPAPPPSGDYYHHHYYPRQYHHAFDPLVPPPPLPPSHSSALPESQHINTLFLAGLPDDVKPREIHNLFRRRPGFDFCQLKYTGRGDQVVAFVTFFSHHAAVTAMRDLNGSVFDPETGATLHVELAKSNSRKRSRGAGAYMIIDKREKIMKDEEETSNDEGDDGSDEPSGTDIDNSNNKGSPNKSDKLKSKIDKADSDSNEKSDIRPCSTLFIANLGPNCTFEELKQVLSQYSGFKTLKLKGRRGVPVAFVDFEDIESSTSAMNGLRGALLDSSDRGGMHVEYAKSKMKKG